MVAKKDFEHIAYIFGIVSIVLAFFQPLAGFIFGIIGFNHAKKGKGPLAKKAKKYNKIGIIISLIIMIFLAIMYAILLLSGQGLESLANLPGA